MLKNYLNSLVTIGNNIDEKIISKIVNALDKTTKNKKKNFYMWKWRIISSI